MKVVPTVPPERAMAKLDDDLKPTRTARSLANYEAVLKLANRYQTVHRSISVPGEAVSLAELAPRKGTPWSAADRRSFEARLKKLSPILDQVAQLDFSGGLTPPPPATKNLGLESLVSGLDFPVFASLKGITKDLAARAAYRANLGKPGSASDLLLADRLSRAVNGHGLMIQSLVGIAMEAISRRSMQVLARNKSLSNQDLMSLLKAVALDRRLDPEAETLRYELHDYVLPLIALLPIGPETVKPHDAYEPPGPDEFDPVDEFSRIIVGHPAPFNRQETLKLAVETYGGLIRTYASGRTPRGNEPWMAEIPEVAYDDEALRQAIKRDPLLRDKLRAIENPLGKFSLIQSLGTARGMQGAYIKARADRSATLVILAASLYERRNNREPASVAELVKAGLLETIPLDPYDGKPMRIDPKRNVVWSVGLNGKDEGGVGKPGVFLGVSDYVWPLDGKFPAPPARRAPPRLPPGLPFGPAAPLPGSSSSEG